MSKNSLNYCERNKVFDMIAAMKFDEQTGEKVPDYKVRLEFHRILGKLLGF